MSNDCQNLITASDCQTTLPAPAVPGPAAGPQIGPAADIHPVAPPGTPAPVRHLTDHLSGLHAPQLGEVAHVAGTSLVCGMVVVAMLVMIVAVAAGWPLAPHRLRNFAVAAWALPVVSAIAGGSWSTPLSLFWAGATQVAAGDLTGLRMMLVLGAPVAGALATYCWAKFLLKTNTVGLKHLGRTERVRDALDARKSAAAARAAKLGAPFSAGSSIVLGTLADHASSKPAGLWRELTARHQHWLLIPHKETKKHRGIFATTGSGKTELIKTDAVAVFHHEWMSWWRWKDVPAMAAKHPKPQLVLLTCKGGEDDKALGRELLSIMTALGIPREEIALVMPGGDRLDIFSSLPARDMRAIVGDLLNAGQASTSEGQHFDEMRRRVVSLVIDAPIGPPRSPAEFLRRLDEKVLKDIWNNAPDVVRQVDALQAEKVPQIDDALIKCSNLFDSLKDHDGHIVFEGGKSLDQLSVLFMTVPGLDKDAGRAQIAATLRLVMQRAGRTAKDMRRSVTVYLDEVSALTTKQGSIGLEDVAERGRSQGVAMVFAGQSPESVAGDKWSLDRLLKALAGGLIIGYFENAGELCKHFGAIRTMLPSRHLIKGQRHGDEGQVSYGEKWLVPPERVREFQTGEFVWAKAGHAYFGMVVRVDQSRLTPLPGTPAAAAEADSTVIDDAPVTA